MNKSIVIPEPSGYDIHFSIEWLDGLTGDVSVNNYQDKQVDPSMKPETIEIRLQLLEGDYIWHSGPIDYVQDLRGVITDAEYITGEETHEDVLELSFRMFRDVIDLAHEVWAEQTMIGMKEARTFQKEIMKHDDV